MKKHLILIGLALVASCACGPQKEFTLLTYNVGVFSKYLDNSTADVAALILDTGASFVALNELDSCNRRHPAFQLQDLSDSLGGWPFVFASAFPFAGGGYGNGVLCKEPVLKKARLDLPKADGSEARSVAVVETASAVFASTHLDYQSEAAALEQAQVINDWFTEHYKESEKPVFLCGDMNAGPQSPVISKLKESWTQLSGEDFTYSTGKPKECIDYVFALTSAKKVKVIDSKVLTEGTKRLSDHFPVKVSVKF